MDDDYPWPCDLRIAHGPHENPVVNGETVIVGETTCPGVAAHPNTMIGRAPKE